MLAVHFAQKKAGKGDETELFASCFTTNYLQKQPEMFLLSQLAT